MGDEKADVDKILKELETSQSGLTEEEAQKRIDQYGYNEIQEKKENRAIKFLKKFWAPVPWMLEATIVITALLGKYLDTYIILFLLVFNAFVGFFQESKAENAVELLKQKLRVKARVVRSSNWKQIEARFLVPGDVIDIRLGDVVPADSVIISGSLEIDQSALTGESVAVSKDRGDTAYSGSIVKRGEALAVVVKTGSSTYFGKTTDLIQSAGTKSHIESLIFGIVRDLIILDVILVLITAVYSYFIHIPIQNIIPFILVLLIASIPVALPATFTIAMAYGALDISKKGAIVTRLSAIEDAASMDVLCSDKTGTITKNHLTVADPIALNADEKDLIMYAAFASEVQSDDPIDKAILEYARSRNMMPDFSIRTAYTPFDPSTKRTEAVIRINGKTMKVAKGAPQIISQLCSMKYDDIMDDVVNLAKRGYRVIAVGAGEDKMHLAGLIPLYDPPRDDSKQLISDLKDLGISVKMVTGDNAPIAEEIGKQVGIEGKACNIHTDGKFSDECAIYAEVFPEDKFKIVKSLQEEGHITGMTGDGVNDAPALRQAEVGIAVSNATDIAKASASIVLTHEGISDIVEAVREGRRIFQRMLTYTLNKIVKTIQVVVFLTASFFAVHFFVTTPFDIILLLFANDFVTMSIATDNVRYSNKPEKWNVKAMVVTSGLIAALLVVEGFIILYTGLYLHFSKNMIHTLIFDMLVFSGLFNVFMVRERGRFWHSKPSRYLMISILGDIIGIGLISALGILVSKIPVYSILMALAFAFVWMAFLDTLKNYVFRIYGL
ncbi:plasma-membrane proton-efflux P-type ATPase [Thermoplasma sp. Kam2015]|uniref:plasma-membrane proton-efflux P-type ATPase n=1 Tax=Thermoplasma sp. Kam2015 TaxID=2094122 RepID=UPI000D912457|nr:plasma-membrane proton-efflux P-type ATPase [Thermoplasma sp. Kam2015]PYB68097.1 plasma-membrane proton-efflux P-type ATPase [Thermoplasma sp. Kam2015]